MAAIYGLVSNRDNQVFYVGQTGRDESTRFYEHYWNPKKLDSPLYQKINRDRRSGFDIYCEVLEYCSFDQRHRSELNWVRGLSELINQRLMRWNGWGSLSKEETARIEAIRESRRGGVPNWCGHIGVTHYPGIGAWQVQIQHWNSFNHLPGNGGPSWMDDATSHWYFSDGIEAILARDRERERLDRYWRDYRGHQTSNFLVTILEAVTKRYAVPYAYPTLTPEALEFFTTTTEFNPIAFCR